MSTSRSSLTNHGSNINPLPFWERGSVCHSFEQTEQGVAAWLCVVCSGANDIAISAPTKSALESELDARGFTYNPDIFQRIIFSKDKRFASSPAA